MSYVSMSSLGAQAFSMRWGPRGAPTDNELFGRGCSTVTQPEGHERELVLSVLEAERNQDYAEARCAAQFETSHPAYGGCMSAAAREHAMARQTAQADLDAYCQQVSSAAAASAAAYAASVAAAQAAQAAEEEPHVDVAPPPAAPAPRDNTLLYVAVGVGVLAVGYMLLR
jgi:hypothetical protein